MKNMLDGIQNTLLLGAGPSGVAPATYYALSRQSIGHLDPYFIQIMDEIKRMLKGLFGTENDLTVPLPTTGSGGMEAAFVNVVEKGDKVLILQNGTFGVRMTDVAQRLGGDVKVLEFPWGTPIVPADVEAELKANKYAIVAMVFAETSTGVRNPIEEISAVIKANSDAIFLVDAVTAIGGIPVKVDEWGVDVCYAGSQKCLSCPPGIAPITFSQKAVDKILNRAAKVPNWYLDMSMIMSYWGGKKRVYHHTAPINMLYGFYQALFNIYEEGMENAFARHQAAHEALLAGMKEIGWEMLVKEGYRLPMLNALTVPEGIDEAAVRARLLNEYGIEISSGLGALNGKIVRVGLMGYNAKLESVDRLVAAMKEILA